jgi:hypothetical protein
MKRVLSALVVFALSSSTIYAQAPRDSATHASLIVHVRRSYDIAPTREKTQLSIDSGRSHAVRNGAIIGAAAGATAGVVGSTYIHFGCLTTTTNRCMTTNSQRVAAVVLGAAGALSGALVGAVVGKLVSLTLL